MKNNYSLAQRNEIVEKHLWCIDTVIRQNRQQLRAARRDYEDVYQQLAVRLIKAVAGFDPEKGELAQHIFAQLRFELRNCLKPHYLYGITGLPKNFQAKVISLDSVRSADICRAESAA